MTLAVMLLLFPQKFLVGAHSRKVFNIATQRLQIHSQEVHFCKVKNWLPLHIIIRWSNLYSAYNNACACKGNMAVLHDGRHCTHRLNSL